VTAAAVLAVGASIGYGASDFLAGLLVRRIASVLVAMWSQVLGTAAFVAAALASGRPLTAGGALLGLAAGAVAAGALLLFYRALELGPTSVVAPVGALGTLIPVGAQILGGEPPGALALAGVPLAVGGLALVSLGNAQDDRPETNPCPGRRAVPLRDVARDVVRGSSPIGLALAAAAGFGAFFLLLDAGTAAAPGGELWVIAAVLVAALPLTVGAAVHQGASLRPALVLAPIAAVAVLDLLGDAALTFATTEGDIGTVGVLASLDPLVTVLLAVAVAHERLPARQLAGVVACIAGVVLVAAG
jgi:drug/metabolite transporter (DMT)-like permease